MILSRYKNKITLSLTIICLILGITIAWQYQSVKSYTAATSVKNQRQEDIIAQLLRQQENNANLSKKLSESNEELNKLKSTFVSDKLQLLSKEVERLSVMAGLTEVRGQGLIVTVKKLEEYEIHDEDLIKIINELRTTDAQAISINNERIVATSEVRYAGGNIMVNGKQMPTPFIVKAIFDSQNLDAAQKLMEMLLQEISVFVDVKMERTTDLIIPKVRDEVIKYDLLTPVNK